MSLTIELPPAVEQWLNDQARRQGKQPQEVAASLLEKEAQAHPSAEGQRSIPTTRNDSLLALLDRWDKEDETDDPEELDRRDREWEELKRNLNANRAPGERKLFP